MEAGEGEELVLAILPLANWDQGMSLAAPTPDAAQPG